MVTSKTYLELVAIDSPYGKMPTTTTRTSVLAWALRTI